MMSTPSKQDRSRNVDEVTEAGFESFPASDPPAFNARDGDILDHDPVRSPANPTTAELRGGMDSRRTVGISSAQDPSAAPFDTDDEAAGRPAQASAIRQAMAHENVRLDSGRPDRDGAIEPRPAWNRTAMYAIGVLLVALVIWMLLG
jgi:hypothetical protein